MPKNKTTKNNEQPDNPANAQPNNETTENGKSVKVLISPPNIQFVRFSLLGESHLSINRFSLKAQTGMAETQKAGTTSRSRINRKPKDFDGLFREAQYRSTEGWAGVHAAAIRKAMISACSIVGFKMTLAKKGIFVVADGYDAIDKTPLVRIWGSEPHKWVAPARNANGSFDLRSRPRWNPGEWELRPGVKFDGDMFTISDITNLLMRVGVQVGIGEGRPDSKDSAGLEYGLFEVRSKPYEKGDEVKSRRAKAA